MIPATEATPYRSASPIIRLVGIEKTYFRGDEAVKVLDKLSIDIPAGSYEALMGPSGSGKSTLLNLMPGSIDPPRDPSRSRASHR